MNLSAVKAYLKKEIIIQAFREEDYDQIVRIVVEDLIDDIFHILEDSLDIGINLKTHISISRLVISTFSFDKDIATVEFEAECGGGSVHSCLQEDYMTSLVENYYDVFESGEQHSPIEVDFPFKKITDKFQSVLTNPDYIHYRELYSNMSNDTPVDLRTLCGKVYEVNNFWSQLGQQEERKSLRELAIDQYNELNEAWSISLPTSDDEEACIKEDIYPEDMIHRKVINDTFVIVWPEIE